MFLENSHPGLFIDVEGLDGCGSSTQLERVASFFKKENLRVHLTKEPTGNVLGGIIRGALTNELTLDQITLQLLFAADRGKHLQREIIPLLKKREVVISDRYFWSSLAFGSVDIDFDWLIEINQFFIKPDLTFFLKVTPEACVERIRKSRFELEYFEKREFLEQAWTGYERIKKRFKDDVEIIDGERKIDEITGDIIGIIQKHPKYKKLLIERLAL